MYICPVCGNSNLDDPPYTSEGCPSYNICSCCGFEPGFDDSEGETFESYRIIWLKNGGLWFSEDEKPKTWNLSEQLSRIKIDKESQQLMQSLMKKEKEYDG